MAIYFAEFRSSGNLGAATVYDYQCNGDSVWAWPAPGCIANKQLHEEEVKPQQLLLIYCMETTKLLDMTRPWEITTWTHVK